MKFVNQSCELFGTPASLKEAWEFAARAARNCYQSTKTNESESEEDFCKRILLKNEDNEKNHMSPLEFGTVYLYYESDIMVYDDMYSKYHENPYSRAVYSTQLWDFERNQAVNNEGRTSKGVYVTTNLRVIIENGWESDLKYACTPTKFHIKTCCFKLITSIHCYKDLTRHRTLSFAIESTRYCKYSNDKYGNGLTFIRHPKLSNYTDQELGINEEGFWIEDNCKIEMGGELNFLKGLAYAEYAYMEATTLWDWTAQDAASLLPQDTKATVFVSGFEDSLKHIFKLRAEEASGKVLPQLLDITKPMYREFLKYEETAH